MPSIKQIREFLLPGGKEKGGKKRPPVAVNMTQFPAHKELLPEDLTGWVAMRAVEEAEKIRARITWIDGQLEKVADQLAAARRKERGAMQTILRPGPRRGDILSRQGATRGPALDVGAGIKTDAAMKIQKEEIQPILKRRQALEFERNGREQELGELRRIVYKATEGEVGLITHLSQKWQSRLEIGSSMIGQLPPAARALWKGPALYVDAAGYPLPPAALDAETGQPDIPLTATAASR